MNYDLFRMAWQEGLAEAGLQIWSSATGELRAEGWTRRLRMASG